MYDTINYKIANSYMLPYQTAIDEKAMDNLEKTNQIINSSRIYLFCRIRQKGLIFKKIAKPEVLYVGETFNKKNRFSPHKKLLQATTMLKRKDFLAVYFLQMRFSYLGITPFQNVPLDIFNDIKDLYSKTSVRLLERLFIKLFNPILNEKHNDEKVKEDLLIQDKLIKNNIRYVILDVGMNDFLFNFIGGKRVGNQDWYTFDLENNEIKHGHSIWK